jgi:hypothetical protein
MAAVGAGCEEVVTTDEDFFDPANKVNAGGAKKGRRVAEYIKKHFVIRVVHP